MTHKKSILRLMGDITLTALSVLGDFILLVYVCRWLDAKYRERFARSETTVSIMAEYREPQ